MDHTGAVTLESGRFKARFAVSGLDVSLAIEAEALGTDYQANGYATVEQVDEFGSLLGLGPGMTLLDLGAGCGWPGLYLAQHLGCNVISTEPLAEGATTARRRAIDEGIDERAWPVVAEARHIPLRRASVDAVVHTDVMC